MRPGAFRICKKSVSEGPVGLTCRLICCMRPKGSFQGAQKPHLGMILDDLGRISVAFSYAFGNDFGMDLFVVFGHGVR